MKYLRKFYEHVYDDMSIENWCQEFDIENYTINYEDGTVDVDSWVDIADNNLSIIPIQFGIVTDYFECSNNELLSAKGSPRISKDSFDISNNKLKTLEYGPTEVGSYYDCSFNNLISLEGFPEKLVHEFYCEDNPIFEIYKLFYDDYETYKNSLDYNYLRGTNIIKHRLKEALEEINEQIPESIPGYKYI